MKEYCLIEVSVDELKLGFDSIERMLTDRFFNNGFDINVLFPEIGEVGWLKTLDYNSFDFNPANSKGLSVFMIKGWDKSFTEHYQYLLNIFNKQVVDKIDNNASEKSQVVELIYKPPTIEELSHISELSRERLEYIRDWFLKGKK